MRDDPEARPSSGENWGKAGGAIGRAVGARYLIKASILLNGLCKLWRASFVSYVWLYKL